MISRDEAYTIIANMAAEYKLDVRNWDITFNMDDLPNTLRFIFENPKTKVFTSHLFHLDNPDFIDELKQVLNEAKYGGNKYRDILVEQIKSAGQQLIDRAEEMVSEKLAYVTDFSISIDIPQPADRPVSISWKTETIDTNRLK